MVKYKSELPILSITNPVSVTSSLDGSSSFLCIIMFTHFKTIYIYIYIILLFTNLNLERRAAGHWDRNAYKDPQDRPQTTRSMSSVSSPNKLRLQSHITSAGNLLNISKTKTGKPPRDRRQQRGKASADIPSDLVGMVNWTYSLARLIRPRCTDYTGCHKNE